MSAFTFYLGTHNTTWLTKMGVPLFVSRRRMPRKTEHWAARGPWALDSGGFSELTLFGRWTISAGDYAREARRFMGIGRMVFAAAQDWMCEPHLVKKTGRSVAEHQALTVGNYLDLRSLAPEVPWLPVVQGFAPDEYLACVRRYEEAGVDLAALPLVGLGSVCRRQATGGVLGVARELSQGGVRLHAFGVKLTGLPALRPYLASSDSMAWSLAARRDVPLPECVEEFRADPGRRTHKNCANCPRYALRWRGKVLRALGEVAD